MQARNNLLANLPTDFRAGLVVYLVALPLCLGISLASGAPLLSGIISGIVAGLLVSVFSGSELSVSGPAAGLTLTVFSAISSLGSFQAVLLALTMAGAMQVLLGFMRAGVIAYYFPSSVIKGMLAAIGLILILKQIPHAFGFHSDYMGNQGYHLINGGNTFSNIFSLRNELTPGATIISLLSFAILILWEQRFVQRIAFFRVVPAALIVVVLGITINLAFQASLPQLFLNKAFLVSLPLTESPLAFFKTFKLPDFSLLGSTKIWVTAITIAIVASMETLLSIEATDKIDPMKRKSQPNRELKAQGLGNIVCGLVGGLPITAVIVRSSANINAGAKSRLSAMIHGLLLLASILFFPSVLNLIPLASLAAILIMVGYKLARVSLFHGMFKLGWNQFIPFIVTIVAILRTELLTGIAVGMSVSFVYILLNNYKRSYYFDVNQHPTNEPIKIQLAEEVTFLNKASIALTLDHLPNSSQVVIDGSRSINIDYDVLEIINEFAATAKLRDIHLELIDIPVVESMGH